MNHDPNHNYDPNQFSNDPNEFGGFEQNQFGDNGSEFVTYARRKKLSYFERIGGGSLGLSLLVHALLIVVMIFWWYVSTENKKKEEEVTDFLPGGGGGGKSNQAKMATKRKSVSMSTPKARNTSNVANSTVVLPDVATTTTNTSISSFTMPTAGGMGGGEGGLRGAGKGGMLGDGHGKGVGPGNGVGFVSGLPKTLRSRCSPQERAQKMRENGGTPECERAVVATLEWLKKTQNPDGTWGKTHVGAMTGFALLAYYGHCETTDSPFYGETVMKGIQALQNMAEKHKGYFSTHVNNHAAYEHGIGCYALGETYSFAKLAKKEMPGLREAFEKGVEIIIYNQVDSGGTEGAWNYGGQIYNKSGQDISVTGWQFQALKAAQHTNLKIGGLDQALKRAEKYLVSKKIPNGGFGQAPGRGGYAEYTMTGLGVLGLQTIGSGGNKPLIKEGIKYLYDQFEKDPADWNKNCNLYCWYYTNQAFFQHGGKEWTLWNSQFQKQLLKNQKPDGSYKQETGDSGAATSSAAGGDAEIYRACLCTLMLEVYYRYLKVGTSGEGGMGGGRGIGMGGLDDFK